MVEPRNPQRQLDTPPERLVKATVARGRSIVIATGRKFAGLDKDSKEEIYVPIFKTINEGEEVELPASDVQFQRERGYLTNPNAVAPPPPEGPIITRQDGFRPGLVERRI
jgi:hypothetical protein